MQTIRHKITEEINKSKRLQMIDDNKSFSKSQDLKKQRSVVDKKIEFLKKLNIAITEVNYDRNNQMDKR